MRNATATIALMGVIAGCGWAQEVLTLDRAVAMAVENNRALRSSSLEAQKAEEKLKSNWTRQFPSVNLYALGAQQLQSFDFTLQKGVLGTYSGTGPLPSEDVHLKSPLQPTGMIVGRVVQPLSSLIRIRRNLDTLKTGVGIAHEQTRADRQKIAREVKRVYYALQQVEANLRSVHQTVVLYQELARITQNYLVREVALKSDSLEVDTRLAKAELSESVLRDQRASGKEQLNQLLGRDVLAEFEIQPVAEVRDDSLDLAAARQKALEQRPEVRQAKLRQTQAEQDLRAKKAEYIPDVSAEVNSMSFLNFGQFFPAHSTSVGVSVSWEPFDWGRKKHEAAEKEHTVAQTRNSQQDAINTVLLDVNDRYRQLRQSRTQLRVARLSQETAIESLRVAKNKFAVQSVLLKDVLQVQVSLEQSNSDYQQALVSFWNARAEFERALGEDQ
ncbi:MAG TPA: TolC family protein [Candidatus Solibacter sp.]|nr:TolC family protein [Candidatus Solibacter sp.]